MTQPSHSRGKKYKASKPRFCRDCRSILDDDEFRDRCRSCIHARAVASRAKTGKRLLAQAKDAGTEQIDGKTFKVVKLPPKRR